MNMTTKKTLDKRVTIRISTNRLEELHERAAYYSVSVGDIIRAAIDMYLQVRVTTDD